MRAETSFLRELDHQLRFLKPKDREEFTSNYRLQIYDRFNDGEKIIDIIDSLESPKLIAKNIYDELEINVDQLRAKSYKTLGITKIFLGLTTMLPQTIAFTLAITFLLLAVTMVACVAFILVMLWINFDPLQAIGASILTIGLLPLLAILFYYIGIQIYKFEKIFFKISVELILGREFKVKQTDKEPKNRNVLNLVMISLFATFTIFGLIGSFGSDKTIGGASLSKNMINSFEREKEYEFSGDKVTIDYSKLSEDSWYKIVFVKDKNLNGEIKIKNDHAYKSSLLFNFDLVKSDRDNKYKIEITDVPWNLVIFNLSSSIYTITYNPTEVVF